MVIYFPDGRYTDGRYEVQVLVLKKSQSPVPDPVVKVRVGCLLAYSMKCMCCI
jgi:hypothetical protein